VAKARNENSRDKLTLMNKNTSNGIKYHENLLRVIAEVEDYAIIFMDIDGVVRSWNGGAQKITGYKKSEIIGENFKCLYNSDDIKTGKPDILLATARKNGRAMDEGLRKRKDGSVFWASVTVTVAHNEEGKIVGFGKLLKDLTEHKMAEQAHDLEIKNRELEQFNYFASHDLLEPLRSVTSFAQFLEEEIGDKLSEDAKFYLKSIKDSTTRMSVLIKALLEYSRIGKKREFTPVNLDHLLSSVIKEMSPLIIQTNAEIKSEELPIIIGMEPELKRLFHNLIDNAIKFRKKDEPPKIYIGFHESFNEYEFLIRDNGIGINPAHQSKIFNIFQRLHKEDEYPGYGIGLAICKKIAEVHNGMIKVQSKLGEGSEFRIILSKFMK
jgi:PAS domain S-box-containing protein